MVVATPNPFSLLRSLYALFKFPNTCSNDEHAYWFRPQAIRTLAARNGYVASEFELIADYELDNPSPRYRLFARLVQAFRWLIPNRIRCNSVLFVLEPSA